MLSSEEKREMLEDARSAARRDNFRAAEKLLPKEDMSFDDYLRFLDDIQKIFGEFPISKKKAVTERNKL